jgi:hypothetical protein
MTISSEVYVLPILTCKEKKVVQSTEVYPLETHDERADQLKSIEHGYKNMETALYAYMFGAIGFLELLTIFESSLNIPATDQARLK